jgi:hypothetical protein
MEADVYINMASSIAIATVEIAAVEEPTIADSASIGY